MISAPGAPPQFATPAPVAQRLYGALVPISAIVGLALFLFLLRGFWPILLLPLAVTAAGGAIFGDDWRRERDRRRRGPHGRGWH